MAPRRTGEQWADLSAKIAAIVVGLVGVLVVVAPAVDHFAFDDPFEPGSQTEKVVTVEPDGKETVQTTTSPADPSLAERALGDGGLLLLRLGVVALAAFLAGAVVQRTALARFDLKVAGLEIPDITEAADKAIAALTARLEEQEQATGQVSEIITELTRAVAGAQSPPGTPPPG